MIRNNTKVETQDVVTAKVRSSLQKDEETRNVGCIGFFDEGEISSYSVEQKRKFLDSFQRRVTTEVRPSLYRDVGTDEVQGQDVIVGSSQQVQTLQTAPHETELQNQQLQTRVTEMESHVGILMSYMLWMEERLTVLEKRLPGLPPRT
uniref:Uncharacterized protein n=1 Tax=Tanacetum cinerariifolium TaxID=118510 RepID=A0A6L2LFB8_TANCI|nr:hypothetical protein [Tanacetum cinerariifolium]